MPLEMPTAAPSSTARAAGIGGAIASIAVGLLAIFYPEAYERVPPGMEAGVATLIAFLLAWARKETVYHMVSPKDYDVVLKTDRDDR